MKHAIKSLALAAMLATAGLANAADVTVAAGSTTKIGTTDVTFNSGSGALEFSNGTGVLGGVPTTSVGGLVGALNVGKVALTSVDGAAITETKVTIGRATPRGVVSIGATVTALTTDNQTGQVSAVTSLGGAQQDAGYLEGVLDGGRMTVKNLRFDLTNKVVYADLSGQALQIDDTLGPVQTSLNTALWTISSVTGPTALPPAALLAGQVGDLSQLNSLGYTTAANADGSFSVNATNILGGLKVTQAGFDFFASSLGLTPGSTGYTTLAGVNGQSDGWGSVKSTLSFTVAAVPEPSTYALAAVGLMVVGVAARRRQKA